MTTNIPGSPTSVAQLAQDLKGLNEDKSWSTGVEGVVLEGSSDDIHWPASRFTITIPKWVQRSISLISPTLDESAWHHLVSIAFVICAEVVLLKWIHRSDEDVLSAIFFTFLLGSFAWPVWSDLKRIQSRLGGVSGRVESLQRSIESLKSPRAVHPTVEHVTVPAEPNISPSLPKEYSPRKRASKRVAKRVAKSVDPELERPVEPQVATRRPPYLPYEIPPTPEPVTPPVVTQSSTPFVSSVTSDPDAGTGVEIEGLMDNIIGEVEIGTAGVSAEQYRSQPTPTPEPAFGPRFPALREIKQRIEQLTEGRLEMTSHSDQSESSNLVSLRRCGVRLLMSVASLDPADFASPVGFFGPSESTPYYPTGDLQRDRGLAHVIAIGHLKSSRVISTELRTSELPTSLSSSHRLSTIWVYMIMP
ncbi:hypothetical protein BC826DRAFT_299171 [Russula brevipes]|nr:hypothetical protein BC826DRAFT_299171 [Russula brevipes]